MLVKIKDTVYDSAKEPILVLLTEEERANIESSPPGIVQSCSYPKTMDVEAVKRWVNAPQKKPLTKNQRRRARRKRQ